MKPDLKSGASVAFREPGKTVGPLDPEAVARLVGSVGDIALVLDADGRVLDISFVAGDPTGAGPAHWIGKSWGELVTVESLPKLSEMIADALAGQVPRWRQVNHPSASGDVPIRYLAVAGGGTGRVIAVGQDLRANSVLQQRLIQAQQSLERDYLRLRQTEARYRLLFDLDNDPVLVVDAETRRIREANPAATSMARAKAGALVNRPLTSLFDPVDHDAVLGYLGTVAATDGLDPIYVGLADTPMRAALSATAFRQERAAFFLVRMQLPDGASGESVDRARMRELIERMPDAFVLADARLKIVSANAAFLDLSQEVSAARLKGASLGDYLGRAGIDVDLIVDQLREHGVVRNLATILRGKDGAVEEVELSAVAAPGVDGEGFGFSIRSVGRRVRDLPPAERDLPRSVEQLTELVGRMSLKDIVRESTDLIERLCIEAALEYTSDNRASAAEILGVSRQSLYSKLHRHGLGNLVGDDE